MAKVLYGLVITEARGKAGGLVYNRNHGGNYIRAKVSPTQPRTTTQLRNRAAFRTIANRWTLTLTDAQRDPWTQFAAPLTNRDALGQQYRATPHLLYQQRNFALHLIDAPYIDAPPTDAPITNPGPLTGSADTDAATITITATQPPNPTTETALIWATPALLPARHSFDRFMHLITHADPDTGSTWELYAAWQAKYGALVPGSVIGLDIEYVNTTTGQRSPKQRIRIPVQGAPDMAQQASIHISAAQLLTIRATPVQLIPAPGPKKMIVPLAATYSLTPHTTPYTVPTNYNLYLEYADTNQESASREPATGWLDLSTTDIRSANLSAPISNDTRDQYENTALQLHGISPADELTGGDSTLDITITYAIHPLP